MKIRLLKQMKFTQPPAGLRAGLLLPGEEYDVTDEVGQGMIDVGEAADAVDAPVVDAPAADVTDEVGQAPGKKKVGKN